jgi:hypothetical protein
VITQLKMKLHPSTVQWPLTADQAGDMVMGEGSISECSAAFPEEQDCAECGMRPPGASIVAAWPFGPLLSLLGNFRDRHVCGSVLCGVQ